MIAVVELESRLFLGTGGLPRPALLEPVLAAFVWALPRAFRPAVAPEDTAFTLTISGESGGRWSLLRQAEAGNWSEVMGRVATDLAQFVTPRKVPAR